MWLKIQHPENKDDLNTIQAALEVLLIAENQLEGYKQNPLLPQKIIRDSVGTLIYQPLKSTEHDIYRPLNNYIINALEYIGAEYTANHTRNLFERETMIVMGVFTAKDRYKRQEQARHHGTSGGQQQKNVVAPLQNEIKRLFNKAMQDRPDLHTKKALANYIHIDVQAFIQRDPERYARVGPKDKTIAYPYQRYILDSVKDIKVK